MTTAINGKRLIILVMAALLYFVMLGAQNIFAASAGTYTTYVEPLYRNPITGQIEDSGGEEKADFGQGMINSTVATSGLVEIDAAGNVYGTFRLNNASVMTNISFSTSTGGSFYNVPATVTNTTADYSDFRVALPSENAVVRGSVHVAPMGRDVIFFMRTSGLIAGQGDFVSTIDTSAVQDNTGSENKVATSKNKNSEEEKSEKKEAKKDDKEVKKKEKSDKKCKQEEKSNKNGDGKKEADKKMKKSGNTGMYFVVAVLAVSVSGFIVYRKLYGKR